MLLMQSTLFTMSLTYNLWLQRSLQRLNRSKILNLNNPKLALSFSAQSRGLDYQVKTMLKSMLVNNDFLTWFLIGWWLCCQPISCQVWKSCKRTWIFNMNENVSVTQAPALFLVILLCTVLSITMMHMVNHERPVEASILHGHDLFIHWDYLWCIMLTIYQSLVGNCKILPQTLFPPEPEDMYV